MEGRRRMWRWRELEKFETKELRNNGRERGAVESHRAVSENTENLKTKKNEIQTIKISES